MTRRSDIRKHVKGQYAQALSRDDSSGSGGGRPADAIGYAKSIGYSEQEMRSVPQEATVTHGCGNPTALAELKEGETVLDLGCGGGLDAFLAAQRVSREGWVIGLDKMAEMVDKAEANAQAGHYANVEFRVAEIEKLPLPGDSIDVVISNCVINHSLDKVAVFREAYRVLKAGGRMFVSDLVTAGRLPKDVLRNADRLWADWLAVASDRREYLGAIEAAGFRAITVIAEGPFPLAEADNLLKGKIISIQIKGAR